MSIEVFEDYLDRLGLDHEVDEDDEIIEVQLETSWGHRYAATLLESRTRYVVFVSPLVELGEEPRERELHRRMLEIADQRRYVKLSLDRDGDVKLSVEGFAGLDGFGQFRRRMDALAAAVEEHARELAELADGKVA